MLYTRRITKLQCLGSIFKENGYKGSPAFKVELAKKKDSLDEGDIENLLNPSDSLMALLQKTENMLTQNIKETFVFIWLSCFVEKPLNRLTKQKQFIY